MKSIIIFFTSLFCLSNIAFGQNNVKYSRDSIMLQQALIAKKVFVLSAEQYTSFKLIQEQLLKSRDSLNVLGLTTEERGNGLQKITQTFDHAIQNLLNSDQWQQYQAKQKAIQQSFEEHAKQQKIKYTLLNNQ